MEREQAPKKGANEYKGAVEEVVTAIETTPALDAFAFVITTSASTVKKTVGYLAAKISARKDPKENSLQGEQIEETDPR